MGSALFLLFHFIFVHIKLVQKLPRLQILYWFYISFSFSKRKIQIHEFSKLVEKFEENFFFFSLKKHNLFSMIHGISYLEVTWSNGKVREHLLKTELNLEKGLEICKAAEQAKLQMHNFRNGENRERMKDVIAKQNMLRPVEKSTWAHLLAQRPALAAG